jgi:hypothetical protein
MPNCSRPNAEGLPPRSPFASGHRAGEGMAPGGMASERVADGALHFATFFFRYDAKRRPIPSGETTVKSRKP